jgi:hypothetical protein
MGTFSGNPRLRRGILPKAANPERMIPPPINRRFPMAAIAGIIILFLLFGLFFLFRAVGSMGQKPSARARMRHTSSETHTGGPRASGLN